MDPRGRTVLVTGGAARVGRAISLAFAEAGARVIIHYHTSERDAGELVEEIRRAGGEASAIQADLSSPDAVQDLATAAEAVAPVDILINNASVFPPASFLDVTPGIWENAIAVNLRAPFFLTQRIGGAMKARGAGVVINIADLSGIQSWMGYAAHSISKAGLVHFTKVAARVLAPEVRVAAIAPGTVLPPVSASPEEISRLADRSALERIGSPEDVVRAVMFLIMSDFITGEILTVDGGRSLH
ncbi:MAG: SDR family oxidoreductase [Gemmatimonadota bacterium]|nr:SDR family oxidoreductase [Gemmatimonadota bacterium]